MFIVIRQEMIEVVNLIILFNLYQDQVTNYQDPKI